MTQNEIIEMANKAYAIDDGKPLHPSALFHLEIFANLVAQHERERIFGELLKMHEIASSRHNYYLNAVLTIRSRGQA